MTSRLINRAPLSSLRLSQKKATLQWSLKDNSLRLVGGWVVVRPKKSRSMSSIVHGQLESNGRDRHAPSLKTGQGHHATGGGGEGRDEYTETTTEAGT